MDLATYCDAKTGRQTELARALGLPSQLVWQWARRVRQVPPDRCPAVERVTAGDVPVEHLRPDVRWQRVPDADWPHPNGRPCIDVAAPVAQPHEAQGEQHAA